MRFAGLCAVAGCTTGAGVTGPASLTANGVATPAVSAWASDAGRDYAYSAGGGLPVIAYVPWTVVIAAAPPGTACGEPPDALADDTLAWRAEIDLAVPFTRADAERPETALAPGVLPVEPLADEPALVTPAARVVLDPYSADRVLTSGTVTLTAFDDAGIAGQFTATAGDGTTAEATFTANRCEWADAD